MLEFKDGKITECVEATITCTTANVAGNYSALSDGSANQSNLGFQGQSLSQLGAQGGSLQGLGQATTSGMQINNGYYNGYGIYNQYCWPVLYWHSYPIYVCTDKTAKAIEILKELEKEKIIKVKDVPKFIELVEKIAGKL